MDWKAQRSISATHSPGIIGILRSRSIRSLDVSRQIPGRQRGPRSVAYLFHLQG